MDKTKIISNLRAECEQGKIENYLRKVVKEAGEAVGGHVETRWDYVIIGRQLLMYLTCNNNNVAKRIVYRLYNNLEKNFKLQFNVISPSGNMSFRYGELAEVEMNFDIDRDLDPNFSIMLVKFFDKYYTIRLMRGNRPNDDLGAPHLDCLDKHGFDYIEDINCVRGLRVRWEEFLNAYKEAYGETPVEYFLRTENNPITN